MPLIINKGLNTGTPWSNTFGNLNMGNLTAGFLYPFAAENSALGLGSVLIGYVPFPAEGGVLTNMEFRFRGGSVAVETVWTVYVNGAPTGMSVTIPALSTNDTFSGKIIVPATSGGAIVHVQFTAAAAPGSASIRPICRVGGIAG